MTEESKILVGNAFPMTLVRGHQVVIGDVTTEEVARAAKARGVRSFWGHENTRTAAEGVLGVGLRPATPRPAVVLDASGYPTLDGERFSECYVLSPDYREGFRPAIGEEVPASEIKSWHALRLVWKCPNEHGRGNPRAVLIS